MKNLLLFSLFVLSLETARAVDGQQDVVSPTPDAVRQEMQRIESERKKLFAPDNPATRNTANNFPAIPAPAVSTLDIQTIAKKYEQRAGNRVTDELMIFVSFSMPSESLQRVVAQARKAGATVVLNGFKNNSWKATAEAIRDLGETGGNVIINPNAFAKYEIKSVPALIVARADSVEQISSAGCALPDTYVAVTGDVSLEYALDEISRRDVRFADLAARYAVQLKGAQ